VKFYPVFLNIENRKCLVVGGGKVAARKTFSLLNAGAKVILVSPSLTTRLKILVQKGKVTYIKSRYKPRFLNGIFLVIAASDDISVNTAVHSDSIKANILINCVDSLSRSNFIVPAVLRRKDIIIAVSTCGKVPALAKKIKDDLKKTADKNAKKLRILKGVRNKAKLKYKPAERKRIISMLTGMSGDKLKKNKLVDEILK